MEKSRQIDLVEATAPKPIDYPEDEEYQKEMESGDMSEALDDFETYEDDNKELETYDDKDKKDKDDNLETY